MTGHTLSLVLTAAAWAAGGGVVVWLVTLPLHRRSIGGLLASVVLTGTVASVAAMVGTVRAMFITTHDLVVAVIVAVVAGLVAAVTASVAARRLSRDNQALHDAVAAIAQGRVPAHDGRLATQLEQVHRELAATAQRLAASRDREQALERSRRELVAWVSHDLRTPLAGLRAISEALEDGMVEAPELYYKQIHAEVDRLTRMVDDLFDLSRMQAGSFALDTEPVSLDDLVSDCVAALGPLAHANAVRLVGRTEGAATVAGNAPELNRALTNLVANAIRHTPGEGLVEVTVRVTGGQAEVAVRDQCGGIPDPTIGRVFEVGFRGEPARTRHADEPGGAGLGLAITRGIVEAHSGTVDVHNVPAGCSFRLRLPLAAPVP